MAVNFNKKPQSLKDWLKAELSDYIDDIAEHGCAGGFPSLTYYTDTVAIHNRFEEEIWDWLSETSESVGHPHVCALISSFGGAEHVESIDQLKNLLVWATVESYAHDIIAERESE
jgi:hypothetical protein